jgi:hypothetical protein
MYTKSSLPINTIPNRVEPVPPPTAKSTNITVTHAHAIYGMIAANAHNRPTFFTNQGLAG